MSVSTINPTASQYGPLNAASSNVENTTPFDLLDKFDTSGVNWLEENVEMFPEVTERCISMLLDEDDVSQEHLRKLYELVGTFFRLEPVNVADHIDLLSNIFQLEFAHPSPSSVPWDDLISTVLAKSSQRGMLTSIITGSTVGLERRQVVTSFVNAVSQLYPEGLSLEISDLLMRMLNEKNFRTLRNFMNGWPVTFHELERYISSQTNRPVYMSNVLASLYDEYGIINLQRYKGSEIGKQILSPSDSIGVAKTVVISGVPDRNGAFDRFLFDKNYRETRFSDPVVYFEVYDETARSFIGIMDKISIKKRYWLYRNAQTRGIEPNELIGENDIDLLVLEGHGARSGQGIPDLGLTIETVKPLKRYEQELSSWFSDDGRVLLYVCQAAKGRGNSFAGLLSQTIGAKVLSFDINPQGLYMDMDGKYYTRKSPSNYSRNTGGAIPPLGSRANKIRTMYPREFVGGGEL